MALKVHRPYPRPCCPLCKRTLRAEEVRNGEMTCPGCRGTFTASVFSPPPEIEYVKTVVENAETSGAPCAKHEHNAAVGNCERCGNFVCALCRTPLGGKTYCVACFERIVTEGSETVRPGKEYNYGGLAQFTALLSLIPPFGLLLGPLSVYYGFKGWRKARKEGTPGRTKAECFGAMVLGVLITLSYLAAIVGLIMLWVKEGKW